MINHRSPNLHYRGWTNTRAFQAGYPGIGSSRDYTQSIKIEVTKLPIIFGSLEFSVVGGNPILFSIFFFFFFFRNVDELSEHLSTGALDPCQRERDRNDIANYACSNFISIFRSRRSRNDGGSTTNVCTVVFRDSSAGRLKKKKKWYASAVAMRPATIIIVHTCSDYRFLCHPRLFIVIPARRSLSPLMTRRYVVT